MLKQDSQKLQNVATNNIIVHVFKVRTFAYERECESLPLINKCIGDDTKAAARQSLNCIKNFKKIKYGEKLFSI